MRESVNNGVLFISPDGKVALLRAICVEEFIARTTYSLLWPFMARFWSSEIDRSCPDCLGWDTHDYKSEKVCEMTYRTIKGASGSMPHVCDGIIVMSLLDVKIFFENKVNDRAREVDEAQA